MYDDHLTFDFGTCLYSRYAEKTLRVTPDVPGDRTKAGGIAGDVITPYGLLSRPLEPELQSDGELKVGCGMMWGRHGGELVAIPIQDPRVSPFLPPIKPGGAMFYGAATDTAGKLTGASYALFDGVDPEKKKRAGSFTLATTYGKGADLKSHVFSMNVRTAGQEGVLLAHGLGHALVLNQQGVAMLRNRSGKAWIATTDEGNVFAGKTKLQGSLSVGEPAVARSVAMARPTTLALKAVADALVALSAAVNGIAPGASAAVAPHVTAIASVLTQISAKHLTST